MSWEFGADEESGEEIRRAFRAYGFAVVRGVVGQQDLAALRSELDRNFDSAPLHDEAVMCNTESLGCAPVWRCLFQDSVVKSLRAALGPELYYHSDLHVQRNSFGQASLQRHSGWHMDAGSETHHQYLRSPEYRFAKCGIFLQDFDNDWGGGIRVKPKSHRRFFESNPLKRKLFFVRRALARAAIRLRVEVDTLHVPTRAGDLCFFDSRLLHCSVLPSAANIRKIGYERKKDVGSFWAEIPQVHTKYVIYWDACNAEMVENFLRNSESRAETESNRMRDPAGRSAVFTRYLSVVYPDDYPSEFVAAARAHGVGVASLSAQRAGLYKEKLNSMCGSHQ
jgi:hypothetical protein